MKHFWSLLVGSTLLAQVFAQVATPERSSASGNDSGYSDTAEKAIGLLDRLLVGGGSKKTSAPSTQASAQLAPLQQRLNREQGSSKGFITHFRTSIAGTSDLSRKNTLQAQFAKAIDAALKRVAGIISDVSALGNVAGATQLLDEATALRSDLTKQQSENAQAQKENLRAALANVSDIMAKARSSGDGAAVRAAMALQSKITDQISSLEKMQEAAQAPQAPRSSTIADTSIADTRDNPAAVTTSSIGGARPAASTAQLRPLQTELSRQKTSFSRVESNFTNALQKAPVDKRAGIKLSYNKVLNTFTQRNEQLIAKLQALSGAESLLQEAQDFQNRLENIRKNLSSSAGAAAVQEATSSVVSASTRQTSARQIGAPSPQLAGYQRALDQQKASLTRIETSLNNALSRAPASKHETIKASISRSRALQTLVAQNKQLVDRLSVQSGAGVEELLQDSKALQGNIATLQDKLRPSAPAAVSSSVIEEQPLVTASTPVQEPVAPAPIEPIRDVAPIAVVEEPIRSPQVVEVVEVAPQPAILERREIQPERRESFARSSSFDRRDAPERPVASEERVSPSRPSLVPPSKAEDLLDELARKDREMAALKTDLRETNLAAEARKAQVVELADKLAVAEEKVREAEKQKELAKNDASEAAERLEMMRKILNAVDPDSRRGG